jgi:hypothetical protein
MQGGRMGETNLQRMITTQEESGFKKSKNNCGYLIHEHKK